MSTVIDMQQRKLAPVSILIRAKVCLSLELCVLLLVINLLSAFANSDPGYETVSGVSFSRSDVYCDYFHGELFTINRTRNDNAAPIGDHFRLVSENPSIKVCSRLPAQVKSKIAHKSGLMLHSSQEGS
jgi:hypothetical protein